MRRTCIPEKPKFASLASAGVCTCLVALSVALSSSAHPGPPAAPHQSQSTATQSSASANDGSVVRGQKLVLKDGSFQLVREYKVEGGRLSYYSLDTHQWEEIPAAMVDWDATKKAAATQDARDASLFNAVDAREKAEHAEVLSIDASIEPAPGIFLPEDPGLFAFDGKAITALKQADMISSLSKKQQIAKIFTPVPIVPTRHVISIPGTRAKLRIANGQPEFYMRITGADEPEIDLVRAKIKGNERQVENVDQLMDETAESRKSIALMRWQVAPNVYRYTLQKPLDPGEYVLIQSIPGDQLEIFLWDFAISAPKK